MPVRNDTRLDEIVARKRLKMAMDLGNSADRLKARRRGTGESDLAAKAEAFDIESIAPPVRRGE